MRGLLVAALLLAPPLAAQGYRLRVDTRFQAIGYRGLELDSIAVTDTVTGPGGGPATPDGFAVRCPSGASYCLFFRPGSLRHGAPFVVTGDLALWGLGVQGVSVHATARAALDFTGADAWPGTDPALQLINGYVEYSTERATARAGRQETMNRLGTIGFDGAGLTVRDGRRGLEASLYGGWGLARGVALPVTSPALNPIDDFQPTRRQLLLGAAAGWAGRQGDVRVDYLREVDPRSDYFVSERVGVAAVVRPAPAWSLTGAADYDLAAGWWGSAEATVGYTARSVAAASVGARRYRPHFDLWTIWGAFSPVPYRAIQAQVSVRALAQVQLRARGERYRFDDAEVETPLVDVEQSGWRGEIGATASPVPAWTFDAGYHREFGPGAASVGTSASITYAPERPYSVTLHGASLDRPLELRLSESVLHLYGIDARLEPREGLRLELGAVRYAEDRRRPDPAAIDWGQWRVTLRAILAIGSGDDLQRLPPARRRMPGGRAAR